MLVGCGALAVLLVLGASFCSVATTGSIPEKPEDTAKADATAFYQKVIRAGTDCDKAFTAASGEMAKGDAVRSYRAVEVAESVCLPVGSDIRAIDVPSSVGKSVHEKLTEAREECAYVFTNKWSAMKDVKKVINGDGGVAEMAGAQGTMEEIQSGSIRCVAGLMGSLTELGVDLNKLPKID